MSGPSISLNTFDPAALLPALTYGGTPVSVAEWNSTVVEESETAEGRRSVREFAAPDGLLAVRVTTLAYSDYPAVRCTPELVGCGNRDSALVEAFHSLDLACAMPCPEARLRAVTGSRNLPSDFSAREFVLSGASGQDRVELACADSRSSCDWMPYFGLDLSPDEGVELAIGWSGAWRMSCEVGRGRNGAGAPVEVRCRFGMRHLAARVRPGEVLRQPSVLLLRRTGMDATAFGTVVHGFMVAHNSPRDGRGELLKPILPVTVSGGNRSPEQMKRVVDYVVRAGLPCDTVWVDAGWYGPKHVPQVDCNCGECWKNHVGDWRVNTGVHPSGSLRGVSDAAHAANLRFLLWFEPERLSGAAPILREHPEFAHYVHVPGAPDVFRLLDLGNPEAWRWIYDTLCRTIEENGVDVYRQDFNMDPGMVWAHLDEPERRGVSEIRHVAGLYRLWDALRERFPDLLIDNCASGGGRLDFELTARSHCNCRSDYFIPRPGNMEGVDHSPARHRWQIVMGQNATLNTLAWIPFQANEANGAAWFDDGEFFSLLGTGIVFTPPDWDGGCIHRDFTPEETAWFKKMLAVADRVRRILSGTFHPLTPPRTLSETDWAAYEGLLPATGEGFAAFFRRSRAPAEQTFALRGLDDGATYELADASTGAVSRATGRDLRNYSVSADPAPTGRIVFFRRLD